MRILYSNPAIKVLQTIPEPKASYIIRDIEGIISGSSSDRVSGIGGSKEKILRSNSYNIMFVITDFKGNRVLYINNIFTDEDLYYYIGK